ncbi:glycosyltransferase [Candidatus Woesearchaeota archaeon]|nr:glycosyltransferase [Candidatus Woesearchaeota archaeon]
MNKIKVFFTIGALYQGGAEHQLELLTTNIDKNKFDIQVISFYGKGDVGKRIEEKGVKVKYLNPQIEPKGINYKTIKATIRSYSKLKKIAKKEKPQVIISFLPHANIISRLVASKLKIRNISSIRVKELGFSWHNKIDKITKNKVYMYTTNSNEVKKFVNKKLGVSKDKIKVIYNGLNLDKFSKKQEINKIKKEFNIKDEILISMVANFREQKDHITLIDAIKILNEKGEKIKCLFVGSGSTENKIKRLIREKKLDKKIILTGDRTDVATIVQASDLFVLATHYEGSPNVVIEAMAAKTPVVVTNIPEIREFVKHEENGLLYKHKNSVDLANKINQLIENNKLKSKLVKEGEKTTNLFKTKRMIEEYQKIIQEII